MPGPMIGTWRGGAAFESGRPIEHHFGGAVGVDDPSRAEHDHDRVGAVLDDLVKSHSGGHRAPWASREGCPEAVPWRALSLRHCR